MTTDKTITDLIFNVLTQAQYDATTPNADEFYITPDTTDEKLANKQDILVSGTNIKTINGTSILGSGDIATASATAIDNIVNGTTTVAKATQDASGNVITTTYVQKASFSLSGATLTITIS